MYIKRLHNAAFFVIMYVYCKGRNNMIKYYRNIPTDCVKELGFFKRTINFWGTWPVIAWHITNFLLTRDGRRKMNITKLPFFPIVYALVLFPCFTMYATEYGFRVHKQGERIDTMIGFTLTGYASFFKMEKQITVFKFENPSWGKEDGEAA